MRGKWNMYSTSDYVTEHVMLANIIHRSLSCRLAISDEKFLINSLVGGRPLSVNFSIYIV
jgi:hypothetical protein